ncbi:MAG: disulfide bond formation protein B [Burkholderiaceae bacterium]
MRKHDERAEFVGWRRSKGCVVFSDGNALLAGIAVCCVGAVAVALFSQHIFDMPPCPWCVLQRAIFLTIAIVCMTALSWRNSVVRIAAYCLALLLSLSGIASALWEHYKAASSMSCSLTLAEKIISTLQLDSLAPGIFSPQASCAGSVVHLLGVPYEFLSLALFILIMGTLLRVVASPNDNSTSR